MLRLSPVWTTLLLSAWGGLLSWHFLRHSKQVYKQFASWNFNGSRTMARMEGQGMFADSDDDLLWFIQISDIHISKFGIGDGASNLEAFLKHTVPAVKPRFVVATGDLTDAKYPTSYQSGQLREEWEIYNELLKKHGALRVKDFWIDLRGNHDCFDVPAWGSQQNLFRSYSGTGKASTMRLFSAGRRKIGLVTIDGCPDFGPSRPFNFFGSLPTEKMDRLQKHLHELRGANVDHVVLASHYPIVTMQFATASDGRNIQELTQDVTAYLSGHLHRLIWGVGEQLYAHRENGMLDLELNDLKDHAFFRIAAFDHGRFTFADMSLAQMPYIVILNPKDSRFNAPHLDRSQPPSITTHLRVLIFGNSTTFDAKAIVNARDECKLMPVREGAPLHVCRWKPEQLDMNAIHSLEVTASGPSGSSTTVKINFRLDGQRSPIGTIGETLMLLPLEFFIAATFWGAYCLLIALILLPVGIRLYYSKKGQWRRVKMALLASRGNPQEYGSKVSAGPASEVVHVPWLLSISAPFIMLIEHHYIWTSFFILSLYLPVGPWLCGWLSPSSQHLSLLSLWGVWTRATGWSARLDSLMFCTSSLLLQIIPSFCLTSWSLYLRRWDVPSQISRIVMFWASLVSWSLLCIIRQCKLAGAYGWPVLVLGLVPCWNLVGTWIIVVYTISLKTIQAAQ